MNPMTFFREPLMIALGWALVHFLWQGSLIALVLALANAAFGKAGSRVRYGMACGALALMVLSLAVTLVWLSSTAPGESTSAVNPSAQPAGIRIAAAQADPATSTILLQTQLAVWLPWLDCMWLVGVLVLAARSVCGWVAAQGLKGRKLTPVVPAWEQKAKRLAQALKISKPVRLSQSALIRLPMVVGWFRPVILVPVCALAGIDPEQLHALLAHELAHIRRHDYLVNLVQIAAETLLFYHPAVWWVGRSIRIERENCCDDIAVSACGDVLTYARALTRLEEMRSGSTHYAVAADGGELLARIRRLVAPGQPLEHGAKTWLAGGLAVLTVFALWAGAQVSSTRKSEAAGVPPVSVSAVTDTREAPVQDAPDADSQSESRSKPPVPAKSKGFIADLAEAGYSNLTVDQLIAFKIHGVTPEYIRGLREVGIANLKPDQLVAFRIHQVDPKQVTEFKAAGITKLAADEIVAAQIHGVTAEYAKQMRGLGFGEIEIDQLVALKIHNVTFEFGNELKSLGVPGMNTDKLIAFRIHGVEAAQVREMQALGLGTVTSDQLVAMRIHNVSAEFVRSLRDEGLTKLSCDDAIAARIHGITAAFIREAASHGFKNLTLDQLIRLKQTGIL